MPGRQLRKVSATMRQRFTPGDGVFDADPHPADDLVDRFLNGMEFASTRFFLWLERFGVGRFVALEAGVLEHEGIRRKGKPTFIRQLLIVHAARRRFTQVDHPLRRRHQQVFLAVGFLLAAVVVLPALLVLGSADGPFGSVDDQQTQLGNFLEQGLQIRWPPGGQKQFPAQRFANQRREHAHPVADLALAQAKEHGHDLLQGIALEVEQHEKKLRVAGGQRAFEPATELALPRLPIMGAFAALCLPRRVEGDEQPLELTWIQRGEGSQQLGFAENALHVHARLLPNTTAFGYPQ